MNSEAGFDVIIIGGGVGGLIVGALLSQKEKKRVLILEKEDRVGGRLIHFRGDDIQKPEDYLRPMAKITGRLARSEPDLKTMIERGLLRGYTFEAGFHGLLNGTQSRVMHILNALGKQVEVAPYQGFVWWEDDHPYKVLEKGPFAWMSAEDYKEMRRVAKEIYNMSTEEAQTYNHISLMDWLKQRTTNMKAIEFHDLNAALLVGLNSADELAAGEYILTARSVPRSGLHVVEGSVANAPEPGLIQIVYNLSDVIISWGGEIRLNQKVKKVLVENNRATGIVLAGEGADKEILASKVVCNVPLRSALATDLVPGAHLPEDFSNKVKKLVSVAGLCPMFGLSKNIIDVPGMHMARLFPDNKEFPLGMAFVYISHSLLSKGKAPEGKQLIEVWIGFSTEDMKRYRRTGQIDVLCDLTKDFMKTHHPGFEEALEWALYPCIDSVLSVAPTPAQAWDHMPDPKCPGIDDLYFVGDSVRNWAAYTDGVAHGALQCMSAITGKDYLELLPDFQR